MAKHKFEHISLLVMSPAPSNWPVINTLNFLSNTFLPRKLIFEVCKSIYKKNLAF